MSQLFSKLARRDSHYKNLKKMCEDGRFVIDTDKAIDEIKTLHTTKIMRRMKTASLLSNSQHNIIDMGLQNSSFRSRLVEIMMLHLEKHGRLAAHIAKLHDFLSVEYAKQLRLEFSTADWRKKALDNVLSRFKSKLDDMKLVIDLSKYAIEDIDKAGYTVSNMVETLKLTVKGPK